jgi:hypothetical protein
MNSLTPPFQSLKDKKGGCCYSNFRPGISGSAGEVKVVVW